MKIAVIVDNITNRAGIEIAVTNLCNVLGEKKEYEIVLISLRTKSDSKPSYELNQNVKVIHMSSNGIINGSVKAYINFILTFIKIIEREKIDIAVGSTHAINILLCIFKKYIKIVGCEHFNYDACSKKSKIFRRIMYPYLDAVVLLTKADAANYSFVDKERLFVIPNIISFKNEEKAILNNKRIIAIGRLTAQKGFDFLIKAAAEMKEKLPEWKVDIYGSGEDKLVLQEMIKQLGLKDYVFINNPIENVQEELLNSSIYVMTSRFEGLPMVLIESQTCGVPAVSFKCKEGPEEIIHDGEDGFLVDVGDLKELVDKIVLIATDDTLRKRLGCQAYINARRYSEDTVFSLWNALFERLRN